MFITALHIVAPLGAEPDEWVRGLRVTGWSGGAPVTLKVASHIVHEAGEDWVAFELQNLANTRCLAAAELRDDSVTWSSFGWPEPERRPDGIGLTGTVESLETYIRRETKTTRTRHMHMQLHSPALAANRSARGYSGGPVLVAGLVVGMIARRDTRINWLEMIRSHKKGTSRIRLPSRRDTSSGGALYALPIMAIVARIESVSDRRFDRRSAIISPLDEQMLVTASPRHGETEVTRGRQGDDQTNPQWDVAVAAISEILERQYGTIERLCQTRPAWAIAAEDGTNALAAAIVGTDVHAQLQAILAAMRVIKPGPTAKGEAKPLLDVLALALPCVAWQRPALQLDADGNWVTSACHPETLEPHMAFRDAAVGDAVRADYLEPVSQHEGPIPRHFANVEYVPEPGMDAKEHARQVKDDFARRIVEQIGEWWFDVRGRKLWYERRPPEHKPAALRGSFGVQPRPVYTFLHHPDPRIIAALNDALPSLQIVRVQNDASQVDEDYLTQELIGEIYREFFNIK